MLDQIKRKRLSLTQQLNNTRPRLKSTQKRKLIQANLQKFQKDVSESRSNSPFQSAQDFYSHKSSSILNQSPTMRDLINPFKKLSSQIQQKQEIQSPRFKQQQEKYQQNQLKNSSPQRKNEEIPVLEEKKQENKQELGNSSLNNSSLLNNLLNRPQKLKQSQTKPEKLQKHVSFGQGVIQNLSSPQSQKNDSKILNKNMQPHYQKNPIDTNQLNFNYNESNYGGSSNGSGILFTSQLRDYINREKQSSPNTKIQQIQPITHAQNTKRKTQQSQHHTQTDKQIGESFLKIGEQELSSGGQSRKKLLHNQSGRSLAFSNQESILKESKLNEHTAVQDIINKKLDQELVLEIDHFVKYKLKDIAHLYSDSSLSKQVRAVAKDLKLLYSILEFIRKNRHKLKRYCFDGMLILKEYKFEQVKNQIKADSYQKQLKNKMLRQTFESLARIGIEKEKKILYNNAKRQEKLKKNIYQVFKLIWFDSKVKRQVDLYYLSKIFSALRNSAAKQRKKWENLALKQYCKSLKRTYFYKIQEGVQTMKKQRLNQQLAEEHYRMTTLKKFFDGWLEQCDRSPQYVSLTMTSKNFFKQTIDNKWLGIKTVDFKQLKE